MQQRNMNTTMESSTGNDEKTAPASSSRGRHHSRLGRLGRSHAMCEDLSPPCSPNGNLISPSIKVIPSTESSPRTLSPSAPQPFVIYNPSPCDSSCDSASSTVVASPSHNSRCSPLLPDHHPDSPGGDSRSSHLNTYNKNVNNVNNSKKFICDCTSEDCMKCLKGEERNINNNLTNSSSNNNNTLTVNGVNVKSNRLRQQSSSQGSFEGSSSSPCLSRDSSSEQYTDTTGINLEEFIPQTLNRNAKDRAFLLRIEQELVSLAKDRVSKTHYKFPPMSSYQRMLVHRCAAYFGMDHNIESSGKCVVVNKTKNTRIPEMEFKQHIKEDAIFSEEPRKLILKRDSNSIEDYKSPERHLLMENRRSKSFEEREEEYEKVRRRIFNREKLYYLRQMRDGGSADDIEWSEIPWSSTDSENSSRFRLQLPEHNRRPNGKLIKVLSEETGETLRPYVAKSYSFGGYGGVLNRGDSVVSTLSAGPRLLTKQDSGASSVSWRLSPSSSGYKSQSQMSESVTPSPTSTPHPMCEQTRQDSGFSDIAQDKDLTCDTSLIWAVTDIQNVPKGSLIIDPESGTPMKNDDGTLYHYDPNNPPAGFVVAAKPPPSPKKGRNRSQSPKKRSNKNSPSKSHVTNSSTSPSLPYSPPAGQPPQNLGFQFISGMGESIPNIPQHQFAGMYNSGFVPPAQETVPVYQQPCIVYTTPYGVPVSPHFDTRLDSQSLTDIGGYYITDVTGAPPPQSVPYQQPPSYWNQQPMTFYQNPPPPNPTPPQRFPTMPMHPQNHPYISSFPQNFQQPTSQPQNNPPPEILPVFPQQPLHVLYQQQTYPAHNPSNLIYTQNPVYPPPPPPNPIYPPPQYPHNTSTPNSCTSSLSHKPFTGHNDQSQNVIQLAQTMAQMNFVQPNQNYAHKMAPFDVRQKPCTPKAKFGPKNFMLSSSQSSTGTNSPAATVVAGYCPQSAGLYRTPPETPPAQFGYGPAGFPVPPMLFRQFSNRATTPGTARSSRSPTPAGDVSYFERQRIPMGPAVYNGMPYVFQPDSRIITGRGQPNTYRHPPPTKQQSFNHQAPENNNRSHKNRKSKGNKVSPNGKPLN